MSEFQRPLLAALVRRLREPRRFVNVLAGPRQVGKTTLARQAVLALDVPHVHASADGAMLEGRAWIETQWERARALARSPSRRTVLLVLDEVQQVPGWSEVVKRLWDEDTADRRPVKVLVLGSSPLLVQRGLAESLAGRFEMLRTAQWSFAEMRDAFGWDVDRYVRFGGYPGAAPLVDDEDPDRWSRYVLDSLVETTLSRDILLMERVDKPALLRRLFELSCAYSGQVLSYTKMLGQLHDAGNTTTLAHYFDLLGGAGMLVGLSKYARERVRRRGSSPKCLALDTGLVAAIERRRHGDAVEPDVYGRLVETAVGAHLVHGAADAGFEVHYWLHANREVDYVLRRGRAVAAIEVKSGRRRSALPGLDAFEKEFGAARRLLVGTGGIPLDEFLSTPAGEWAR